MSKRLGFMFAGQGAQFVGMGSDLVDGSDAARQLFEQANAALGRDLTKLCFDGPMEDLTESANCQPAIYTMSLACLAAFQERVPTDPVCCGGLSLGEFAALTAAGSLDFAAGLRLVATRGKLMGEACRATAGGMAAVLNAEPDLVVGICADNGVDVANYNCPGQIVISGPVDGVAQCLSALQEAGVARVIPLKVDGAFHSRLMAPAAEKFAVVLQDVALAAPKPAVAQNFAGALVEDPEAIRENLGRQVTGSVKWEACVRAMMGMGLDALIEFGPGQTLSGFMRRIDRHFPTYHISNREELEKVVGETGG